MSKITVNKTLSTPFVSAGLLFGEPAFRNDTKEFAIGINGGGYVVVGNSSVTANSSDVTLASNSGLYGITQNDQNGLALGTPTVISPTTINSVIGQTHTHSISAIATLDDTGKIPMSQMPDAVAAGQLSYKGLLNIPTSGYPLTSAITGDYYVNTASGSYDNKMWTIGDLIIYNGEIWQQVQGGQSDVVSVNNKTGVINLNASDVGAKPYKEYILTYTELVGNSMSNPYVAGTHGETRLLVQDYEGAFIMLPHQSHFGDVRDFVLDDTTYEIDTSSSGEITVFLDPRCGFRKEVSRIVGEHINPDSGNPEDCYGHVWDNNTHLTYEAYPQGLNGNTPNEWCVYGDGLVIKMGTGTQSLDGWGNDPAICQDGCIRRFTHSDVDMNQGIYGEANLHLSTAQYSAITGYFGSPVELLTNTDVLTNFALHITDSVGRITLPASGYNTGDTYRFLCNINNTTIIIDSNGGAGIRTINGNHTTVELTLDSTDYFELTYTPDAWRLHTQNFLDYMAGLLPWSKVDKSGSDYQHYKEFIFDVSAASNNGVGLTIDNPYVAGTHGETRLILQTVAGEVWVTDGSGNNCYIMLPYKTHFGDVRDFVLDDTMYFVDTSTNSSTCVFLDPRCLFRKETARIVGEYYNPDLNQVSDVWGHTWDNHTHLQYESYPNNDRWCVYGDGLVLKNGTDGQGLDGWGNDATVCQDGVIRRYTHSDTDMNNGTYGPNLHLSQEQYSAVTGYFGTVVNINAGASIPLVPFALHTSSNPQTDILLPDSAPAGTIYRFLLNTTETLNIDTPLGATFIKFGNVVDRTITLSLHPDGSDYFEFVFDSGRWDGFAQNFLDYMSGLLPWDKIDKTNAQVSDLSFNNMALQQVEIPLVDSPYQFNNTQPFVVYRYVTVDADVSMDFVGCPGYGRPFSIYNDGTSEQFNITLTALGTTLKPYDWVTLISQTDKDGPFAVVAASRPELMGGISKTEFGNWVNTLQSSTATGASLLSIPIYDNTVSGNTVKITGSALGTLLGTHSHVNLDALQHYKQGGFIDRTKSSMSVSAASNTFTFAISGTTGSFEFYADTHQYFKSFSTVTVTGATNKTVYYIYYDSTGTLIADGVWTNTPTIAMVATVYYDNGIAILYDERHSATRNFEWHTWAHNTIGARIGQGFTFNSPTIGSPTTFSLASGDYYDEDIKLSIPAVSAARMWYRTAGATAMNFDPTPVTTLYKTNGLRMLYDNNGASAQVTSGNYGVYWVYANNGVMCSNGTVALIYVVMGQGDYASLALAQGALEPALPGVPTSELKLLYQVIFRQTNTTTIAFNSVVDKRAVSSVAGSSLSSTPTAASISVDATGFNKNLTTSDTNLQLVANKVDQLSVSSVSLVQALGAKSSNFTVDVSAGNYATVELSASVNMSLSNPVPTSGTYYLSVQVKNNSTFTLTHLTADANIISSGGLMSSSKTLPNSGAGTSDLFEYKWNGTKWVVTNSLFDIR